MSRQHSVRVRVELQSSEAKQCTVSCGYDHMPVSRGYMRAQDPLLMAPFPPLKEVNDLKVAEGWESCALAITWAYKPLQQPTFSDMD